MLLAGCYLAQCKNINMATQFCKRINMQHIDITPFEGRYQQGHRSLYVTFI